MMAVQLQLVPLTSKYLIIINVARLPSRLAVAEKFEQEKTSLTRRTYPSNLFCINVVCLFTMRSTVQ